YVQHSTWLGITKWRIEKSSLHSAMSARFLVTVSQYQGVFASAIAHRPGPNLKSGSQTSVRTRRIFILSSVIKKLLFHSIGALNLPSLRALPGTWSNQKRRSVLVLTDRFSSACVGVKSRPNSVIASTMACRWIYACKGWLLASLAVYL